MIFCGFAKLTQPGSSILDQTTTMKSDAFMKRCPRPENFHKPRTLNQNVLHYLTLLSYKNNYIVLDDQNTVSFLVPTRTGAEIRHTELLSGSLRSAKAGCLGLL